MSKTKNKAGFNITIQKCFNFIKKHIVCLIEEINANFIENKQ